MKQLKSLLLVAVVTVILALAPAGAFGQACERPQGGTPCCNNNMGTLDPYMQAFGCNYYRCENWNGVGQYSGRICAGGGYGDCGGEAMCLE